MLAELAVSDLGVIDSLSLLFDPGMTALTGETGAGKTMVVGAIGLLTGDRADPGVVRPGAVEATVQGRFLHGDEEVVLTRVVPRSGRSRAYRDGRLVTAGELAEQAAALVDLHGQHAHVGLLTTASQRRALDRYAGVDLGPLEAARAAVRAAELELADLGGDEAARAREADFLRFQLEEIARVGLTDADEDARLAAEELLLADADAHRDAAAGADAALGTDRGARDLLAEALARLADRAPFASVVARLQALDAELADLGQELRSSVEGIETDPQRLAVVQARRTELTDLRRRYTGSARAPLADLFAVHDALAAQLAAIESHAERATVAEAARSLAREQVAAAGAQVAAQRREHAPALAAAVRARLVELALPKAEVAIELGAEDPADDVAFLLALNPGLPAAPLAKAASGGELARTMLALRLVVGAQVPTLVFDEVDAGVGGAAAALGRPGSGGAGGGQAGARRHAPATGCRLRRCPDLPDEARRRHVHRRPRRSAGDRGPHPRAGPHALGTAGERHRPRPRRRAPRQRGSGARPLMFRRTRSASAGEVVGRARVGKRTKDLIKRLEPGDIAVIDHADIDRIAADGLIDAGVKAVVNAAPSITGRYPNGGPLRLVKAGVVLVDDVGSSVMDAVEDGATLRLREGRLVVGDDELAEGHILGEDEITRRMEEARAGIGHELQRFAENTLEYVQREAELVFAPIVLPRMHTSFAGRHALVVVRGLDYKQDLRVLRTYIREYRPVLIGVDGGADALLEVGLTPDIILGDFDSVSVKAMDVGAEHIHHVHPDGRNPGFEELQEFGKEYVEFVVEGTSEDAAMLLAYEAGAKLIVAVGTHDTMVEFLDKGRAGMSSTFLTRLRLGPMLVDAKGVARLYEGTVRRSDLGLLVLAALAVMLVISIVSQPMHVFLDGIWLTLRDFWFDVTGTF